ncbi:MAG: sarcosine oxidase subunit delta family protein [Citricoccus sp.]|jgi:sarcosine oxidase subunit delta|nr:sarcosine oxidase subunit delta family protein [Citricoccus sp. WCRC_4]
MLSIPCPECGPRDEIEFHYGGQAHVAYPADPHSLDDRGWAEYLFYRDNPKGLFAERWQHAAGCRKWFNALRDTHTYEFAATYRVGEPRPDVADPHPGAAPAGPSTPSNTPSSPAGGTL